MFNYLLLASLGLIMSLGAVLADRSVARHAREYIRIAPSIPLIFFAAKIIGIMIMAAGITATAVIAYS
jgi:hypothetical protein